MQHLYPLSWLLYGLLVIASGCWRYAARPGGEKGLYFGLVMGALAIAAHVLLHRGHRRSAHVAGFTSLGVVTGWFLYEALIRDGGSREPRLLIVAALGLLQAGYALRQRRAR